MRSTLHAAKFLITGPIVLAILFAVNLFASPGQWWFQWAALGIGIAWVVSLLRVLRGLIAIGLVAALVAWWTGRQPEGAPGGPPTPPPP
jgi:pheromone shutdown protein TraB